ncbi:hypothetical protein HK100_009163 [Physocladia obscura]|uniref:BZIP domain-containing protein n=1 Tax=Physocladia obscura TaxID=109957 RepID=A0AAD5XB69_9FUNG|nr:hypothetical protein HK100_009163 [Physocladia obscura]
MEDSVMIQQAVDSGFSAQSLVRLNAEPKKRGHQSCEDTSDKRRSQIREAQRSFRKRQQEYTADLERKVAELTAQVGGNSAHQLYSNRETPAQITKDCCTCYLTNIDLASKNSELTHEVTALNDEVRQLKERLGRFLVPNEPNISQSVVDSPSQCDSTVVSPHLENKQQTANLTMEKQSAVNRISDLINSDDVTSSAELYGYLNLTSFHAELKAIEALKDCNAVDSIILVISVTRLKHHLMDLCSLNERTLVVNVFESNKGSGNFNNHWRHWYQSAATGFEFENNIPDIDSPYLSDDLRALVDVTRDFRDVCAEIPSLLDSLHLVRVLCVMQSVKKNFLIIFSDYYYYFCHKMRYICVDKKESEELFSTSLVMQGLLQVLCETNLDRTKVSDSVL